jgi:transcriptional regulator with XRE-family HTH domain
MKSKQKEMIALLVKEGRLAKGYTQKESSELSNISIRSIQRIENGEIIPRSYTLKTIAEILGLPFENFTKGAQKQNIILKENDDIEIRPADYFVNRYLFGHTFFSMGLYRPIGQVSRNQF